jgi:hypothetical protein
MYTRPRQGGCVNPFLQLPIRPDLPRRQLALRSINAATKLCIDGSKFPQPPRTTERVLEDLDIHCRGIGKSSGSAANI